MSRPQDRKFVSADLEKCTGCSVCEYACSMVKDKTYNPTKSRIRSIRLGPLVNIAITCRHCEDPACVTACPKEALSQEERTGVIMIDEEKCNGCSWCIEACPFGAMLLHPKKRVVSTCDNCKDLGEPQCVKWCPEEALEFLTADVLAQKSRQNAVKQLLDATEKAASEHL